MNAFRNPALAVALVATVLALPGVADAQSAPPKAAAAPAVAPQAPTTPENLFKAWDSDHDGTLSRQEFVAGWNSVRHRVEAVEERLQAQFRVVDANHDGSIDAGEYANLQVVRRAGKSAPPLAAFDANRDQRLQFGEYVAMLRRAATGRPHPAPQATPPRAPGKP